MYIYWQTYIYIYAARALGSLAVRVWGLPYGIFQPPLRYRPCVGLPGATLPVWVVVLSLRVTDHLQLGSCPPCGILPVWVARLFRQIYLCLYIYLNR